MLSRHEIRCEIFKGIFLLEFYDETEGRAQFELLCGKRYADEDDMLEVSVTDAAEIRKGYEGFMSHLSEVDELIDTYATEWRRDRMAKVDLAIIRLAIYEMKFDDLVPDRVAINEAVEIAKEFGQESSPAFVNGVLGRIIRA